jgi:hypothetical protein
LTNGSSLNQAKAPSAAVGELRALIGKGMRFCVTTLVALTFHLVINVGGHELLGIDSNVLYPITLLAISLSTFLLFRFFV